MLKMYYVVIITSLLVEVFGTDDHDGLYGLLSPDQHEYTPRLEDFFWTGSGDGPPPPAEAPVPTPAQPSSTVVRTTTVLATVYLDSYPPQAVTDKTTGDCVLNCGDATPGSLEPEIPEDRRYWLLTVIQGTTPHSLQLKLARLYQKAFLRQQERHLGIIKSLDAPTARKKHEVHSFLVNKDFKIDPSDSDTPLRYKSVQKPLVPHISTSRIDDSLTLHNISVPTEENNHQAIHQELFLAMDDFNDTSLNINATKLSDLEWILANPTMMKREVTDRERIPEARFNEGLIDIPLEADSNNQTIVFKREIIKPEQQPPVHVHIQNISESSETGSVNIVYVVLVGGRAVPAAVAARDMRLVRDAEVARELGAPVTTKAEPAYLKAAEGLAGEETGIVSVQGAELWALVVGAAIAVLVVFVLLALLCRLVKRKKSMSAASMRAYRNEMLRDAQKNQLKQVHEEKDGRLISVVSPSRTRPSSTLLPVYRAASASSTSTTSSGVSEVAAALRRRQKKPNALRIAQKKRVGTTDSLLEAAGLDSSDSAKELSAPPTPTSYLSMPSVRSFPRGNTVEPLSRVLEPVSVRHLDIDSPVETPPKGPLKPKPKTSQDDVVPRRQMSSQLVRLGSIDKDPGVVGPLVWDLHCQRIKDPPKPHSPATSSSSQQPGVSRMRQRFNELVDDAFSLFGSPAGSPKSGATFVVTADKAPGNEVLAQARNDNVRLPGSPYTALDTIRGKSASGRSAESKAKYPPIESQRPRTSFTRTAVQGRLPARAWGPTSHPIASTSRVPTVNPAFILAEGRLPPEDPALPLISAIKSEIEKVRDNAQKPA